MIKKNVKKYALCCLVFILACTMGILVNTPLYEVSGEKITFTLDSVSDNNRVGTVFNLENEIDVTYNGSTVKATNGSIIFPNGKVYSAGSYQLTDKGLYVVKYYVKDGNKIITCEKSFMVTDNLYDLSNNAGTITTVTKESSEGKYLKTNDDDIILTGKDGLILRLNDGCEFIYNKPIDLSKTGENGIADIITLNYRLGDLQLNENPQDWQLDENGVLKAIYAYNYLGDTARRCKIRLTDVYDPDNYIELDDQYARLNASPDHVLYPQNYQVSLSAAANGQLLSGAWQGHRGEDGRGVDTIINNFPYHVYWNWNRATRTGQYLTSSVESMPEGTTWAFDWKTNIVYCKTTSDSGYSVVTDLDNTDIYPSNAFKGFTTGEVYLSLKCIDYQGASSARVDILGLDGYTGKELVDLYGKNIEVDTVAPEVQINYNPTENDTVYAKFGSEFTIPTAFVKEVFSNGNYDVSVYTNYYKNTKKQVSVKNGKFTLNENAIYTIEYTAIDNNGLKGSSVMHVCPKKVDEAIWVETEKLISIETGSDIILPKYALKTINKEEDIKLSIKAVHEKETLTIDNDLRTFRPLYKGKYTIVYEYSDNCNAGSYSYEVESNPSANYKFLSTPVLPRYFVKGDTYALDELYAYDFTSGEPKIVNTDAYASIDGGEFTKVADPLAFKANAENSIKIQYRVGDNVSETKEVKVISNKNENGMFRVYKYFVGDYTIVDNYNAQGRPITAQIKYDMTATAGDANLEFANIIDANVFALQFVSGSETGYSSLLIRLTDVYDESKSLNIRFHLSSASYVIEVNGVKQEVKKAFQSDEIKVIEYRNDIKTMVVDGYKFPFDFGEFTTSRCHFDITMEKVNAPSSIVIDRVGNHAFRGTKTKDDVDPQVSVVTSDGSYSIGETVIINTPLFSDVISQINVKKSTTYIIHEDGTEIEVEDTSKPYELKLDKLGAYTIYYDTMETSGNELSYSYMIAAIDKKAPEIIINDYSEDSMILLELGSIYKLDYLVSDDVSEVENIKVAVRMQKLSDHTTINSYSNTEVKCNEEGDFVIYVIALDESGNSSYKKIYVRVQGGK